MKEPATDLARDLARVEADLRAAPALGADVLGGPDAVTRVVHVHLQRAALTGRPQDYVATARCADRALEVLGPWPDLCLIRADLAVRSHRLADARAELARGSDVLGCTQGRAVLADVLLQEGEVDDAEALVSGLVAEERTWDHLARLAHLSLVRGDLERADALYVEAEDEITAKSMRAFAWVEIERGRLRLLTGELDRARHHYARAERAYSGHWTVQQRVGELDAEAGRTREAVDRLESVRQLTERPELSQALSTLYARLGDAQLAQERRRLAMSAFRASAEAGEVQYLHHLAELAEPAEAVAWARRDVSLRPNHLARSTLAVALHRLGETAEAEREMHRCLATGLRDPRMLARAAVVFGSRDEAAWFAPAR